MRVDETPTVDSTDRSTFTDTAHGKKHTGHQTPVCIVDRSASTRMSYSTPKLTGSQEPEAATGVPIPGTRPNGISSSRR